MADQTACARYPGLYAGVMTQGLSYVLQEQSAGLHRAIAVGRDGRAWHTFQQAFQGKREAVRPGQVVEARVRAVDDKRGAFLEHFGCKLWQGGYEPLFCDRRHAKGLLEGQTLKVSVSSAARRDHAARVTPLDIDRPLSDSSAAFEIWRQRLDLQKVVTADAEQAVLIDEAFEEAGQDTVELHGGGRLYIERTRALTAIDVDAEARTGKGSVGARALSLNRVAAQETARQLCMRRLGGAVILDCVAPLNQEAREKVRIACFEALAAHGMQTAEVLKPSRFGLMELSLPWLDAPIDEWLETSESQLLMWLRTAGQQLDQARGKFYSLHLGEQTYAAYLERKDAVDALLKDKFVGRLSIERALNGQEGLNRQ